MAFKFLAFAAVIAVARAGVIAGPAVATYAHAPALTAYAAPAVAKVAYGAPAPAYAPALHAAPLGYGAPIAKAIIAAPALAKIDADFDPNPQYSYAYDIKDALTGDNKEQHETRNGDVVQGSYSLVEPDGTRRTVEYTADDVNGFNAVVHKEAAVAKAVVAAPVAAYAAPVAAYAAPVAAYAAPAYAKVAAPLAYAAPIAKVGYAAPVAAYAAPAYGAKAYLG